MMGKLIVAILCSKFFNFSQNLGKFSNFYAIDGTT